MAAKPGSSLPPAPRPKIAKTFGVTVKEIVWTWGRYDIVTIVEAPDESSAMSLNLSLGALGNVRTEMLPAFFSG